MTTMLAARFHRHGGPEELVCDTVPRPEPGPGEVLVKVMVAGVNFADVIRRRGDPYPQPSPLPFTPGGESVGVVQACGAGVDDSLLGRQVFAFPGKGCYAEYVVAPVSMIFPVPAGLEPSTAIGLFVQGLTAALVLRHAGSLAVGETVLVQGAAGGVGLLGVQLAKLYGAGLVIGLVGSDSKIERVAGLGADLVVNCRQADWLARVRAYPGNRGVDLVMEMTGGAVARDCLALLAPFGRSIVYGAASREPLVVDTTTLPPGNTTVRGFYLRPWLARRELIASLLEEMGAAVRAGKLQVHIGGTFALRDAADAHRLIESRDSAGKIVLAM